MSELPNNNEEYDRPCTCHPDDNPPRPCPKLYALHECREAAKDRRMTTNNRTEPGVCPRCGDTRLIPIGDGHSVDPCPNCSGKVVKVSIKDEAKIEASLRYIDPVAQRAFIKGYVRAATLHKRSLRSAPAQPGSGEAPIQQCCDDLFEAGRTVAHYEDPRLRPLSKEDFILYDAARKRAAAARDRLHSYLTAVQQRIAELERENADLRTRLNHSERLQGRYPRDAV